MTYGYISDAHDLHVPVLSSDSYSSSATGPGELAHEQQLKDYDTAFENFFDNLKQHGITRQNTLFVITVDEGDHFAGGVGHAAVRAATGWSTTTRRARTVDARVPELPDEPDRRGRREHQGSRSTADASLSTTYDIHPDDAPTFYVSGKPARTDTTVRRLERDVGGLSSVDPYVRNGQQRPAGRAADDSLADPVEEKALHMVNSDPNRTPTFTMFGNPDFFFQTGEPVRERQRVRDSRLRLEPRRRPARDRQHVGRHGRAGDRAGRHQLDHVDRPHEPPADDPVAGGAP